ncbi:hypothetical protein GF312_07250, partial [Candidatus Poribacteria bacterium]|nr:hypothetical protein [Candidatus Poribacteria bacterium]
MRLSRDKKKDNENTQAITRKSSSSKLDTYIGDGTVFEGSLSSKENLSIYGAVKGTVECKGRVIVGDSGDVEADILADEVTISGKVVGNVTAKNKMDMTPSGILHGDIKTTRLIMEDGCKFEGHCEMITNDKSAVKKIQSGEKKPALPS